MTTFQLLMYGAAVAGISFGLGVAYGNFKLGRLREKAAYSAGRADGVDAVMGDHEEWRAITEDCERPWANDHYSKPVEWRDDR